MITKILENISNDYKTLREKQKALNNFSDFIYIMDKSKSC